MARTMQIHESDKTSGTAKRVKCVKFSFNLRAIEIGWTKVFCCQWSLVFSFLFLICEKVKCGIFPEWSGALLIGGLSQLNCFLIFTQWSAKQTCLISNFYLLNLWNIFPKLRLTFGQNWDLPLECNIDTFDQNWGGWAVPVLTLFDEEGNIKERSFLLCVKAQFEILD